MFPLAVFLADRSRSLSGGDLVAFETFECENLCAIILNLLPWLRLEMGL